MEHCFSLRKLFDIEMESITFAIKGISITLNVEQKQKPCPFQLTPAPEIMVEITDYTSTCMSSFICKVVMLTFSQNNYI